MKVSDYIVEYLIKKNITDVFGYPGGMVTQLMDSFAIHNSRINAHVTYHEQAAAFAACGYAQTSGKPGIAYATSGPGATNLITGICNAYFDSIPTIFITGQVNSNESKGEYGVRQRGFQETDIVSIVKPITKNAVYLNKPEDIVYELDKAYKISMSGRKGPVLLDIPMNYFRAEIYGFGEGYNLDNEELVQTKEIIKVLKDALEDSEAPVILIGGGIKNSLKEECVIEFSRKYDIPVVSSMIAFDAMKGDLNYYGFLGAYGNRAANFIVAKSDLIITLGSRMDIRQVGICRENFGPNATIIRFDVDDGELEYRVHENEIQYCVNLENILDVLNDITIQKEFIHWNSTCNEIRSLLKDIDSNHIGQMMGALSDCVPDDAIITTDVGQNQVWVAQYFNIKPFQKVLFSGGHGAMGYSLPAAIGAYYGSGKRPVYCIIGDGGLQMNIQELQFISREKIPIKIIVLNNNALGMIRHFQEMYFDSRFFQTKPEGGYLAPSFSAIAEAYGIKSCSIEMSDVVNFKWSEGAELIEVLIRENTYVTPKLEFGKPNQDQEPLLDRKLYERIMEL